jgi:magnesium-transporting ATPase (P-type)
VTTEDLLPGDIFSLSKQGGEDVTVPCDALMLRGSAVVNEATMTGESTPQARLPPLSRSLSLTHLLTLSLAPPPRKAGTLAHSSAQKFARPPACSRPRAAPQLKEAAAADGPAGDEPLDTDRAHRAHTVFSGTSLMQVLYIYIYIYYVPRSPT